MQYTYLVIACLTVFIAVSVVGIPLLFLYLRSKKVPRLSDSLEWRERKLPGRKHDR